jgi:hypothetical protein
MKVRLLRASKLKDLISQIDSNLSLYRTGNFSFLATDPAYYFEIAHEIDHEGLAKVECSESDHKEAINCRTIFEAMKTITPYLARDERIWVYLTHTFLLDYARKRWPIPEDDEKAVNHIKNHFFAVGARGFERDNAASRLWWMAFLCNRVSDLPINDALESLLYQYDVRANIIERPTTAQSLYLFSAILKKLNESYKSDKKLFEREKFREVMKQLNLRGGIKLLGAMDEKYVQRTIEEII